VPVEQIRWDKHDIVECDDRGRATLGNEYANERILVYLAELPDVDDLGDPIPEEEKRVLSQMLSWAKENDIETMTHLLDPQTGIVTDKQGNKHKSPYGLSEEKLEECPVCDGTGQREEGECSACHGMGYVNVKATDDG